MIIQLNNTAFSLLLKLTHDIKPILGKLILLLIPLPFFMLTAGIGGIIKQVSPESLGSLGSISSGFFYSINMHTMIILGALVITFFIWFITRKVWRYSEDDSYNDKNEEL
ncbi:MAG: hypothetical protein KZQ70_09905 [gamma proteobacterium symbiont of Lucinoma myriamae]|nr:hypothetical protein [gamma proteobacterium symbiont of Lucinoma myriamae]MCU7832901.1 hypothetical protein [gamma proteobacterium symbiont of Lucinoma myriamae]